MVSADVNGITIEYEVRGEGEPLLLIMGLAGQLIDWPDPFVDLFVDAGYQVIRFDNRDIGLSTQTTWTPPSQTKMLAGLLTRRPLKGVGYTLSDMASDTAGLLDSLGIDAAHVLGVSMGGMIGQELAIDHPDRVRSLCSIMSNTGDRRHGSASRRLLAKLARQQPVSREDAAEATVETFRLISGPHFDADGYRDMAQRRVERSWNPGGVARQTAAVAGSRDRTKLLGSVQAPTLVIHGLLDRLVKPSGGIATARAVPGSRLLAFPDMAHDLPLPRWPEMKSAIIDNIGRAA